MRSILVTGVSSGIGAAIARHFMGLGWHVIGTVRRPQDAEALAAIGGDAFASLILDVTDDGSVERLDADVRKLLGGQPLDVLCNNAGTSVPAATVHQSVENFRAAIDLNLVAPFAVTRVLYPLLRKPGGRIVFIGSLAGVDPLPFCSAYSAAKHGIEALAGSVRVELADQGVHVAVVAPGSVATALGSKIGPDTPLDGAGSEFGPAFARMAQHMVREARAALDPMKVARVVERAATAALPKRRYVVTPGPIGNWHLPRLLGRAWTEARWRRRLFA